MTLQIGTILIAKEDIKMKDGSGVAIIKGNEYKINDLILDVFIVKSELFDNHEFDIEDLDKYFTIKRYTITDLNEKKIAVKLKSEEEFKRISPNDDYIWFFDNSYFGYENGQFTFIDNKSLTKQGYIIIPSIDLIDLEEKEESKVVESHHVKQLESIDEIDLEEKVVNECETPAMFIAKLESEIARLKEENEELKVSNQSERTRMAWELYVSGFNHGIADKWTIDECFRTAEIFLNHAKSKEVGNGK